MQLYFALLLSSFPFVHSLTVAGKLECCAGKKTPCPSYAQPTNVVVYNKYLFFKDRAIGSAMSDRKTGNFLITTPFNKNARPYVRIEHTCGAKPGCRRVLQFDVPTVFVKRGLTFSIAHLILDRPFHGKNQEICDG
ncbi:hypothetical protein M3Y99_01225500 [Aphelenchoides fujianensis]|nr:hypothetical protein M3Y99_01225500 [Aphelenchoides fujianensis]